VSKSNLTADLTDLAARIRAEHKDFCTALRRSLRRAFNCGELLIEAKAIVSHGSWEGWVHQQCDFSLRTAQAYIKLSRHRDKIEAKAEDSAFLTIDAALRLIDEEKTDAKKTITVEKQESTAKEIPLSVSKEDRPPERVPDSEIKAAIDVADREPEPPKKVVPNITKEHRPPKVLSNEETQAAIDKANADLDRIPDFLRREPEPPAEDKLIDQQLADVKASIERLIGYARTCNKVLEIISTLRQYLDYIEDHDAKVARPRAGGAR
jgi:hypothetical protein